MYYHTTNIVPIFDITIITPNTVLTVPDTNGIKVAWNRTNHNHIKLHDNTGCKAVLWAIVFQSQRNVGDDDDVDYNVKNHEKNGHLANYLKKMVTLP